MTSVREQIAAWLESTIEALANVVALRPQRVHWLEEVTQDRTVVIRQAGGQCLHNDDTHLLWQQSWELSFLIIDSDSATASVETRLNALKRTVLLALAADPTCGGHADDSGLSFAACGPIDDPRGILAGETQVITAAFWETKSSSSSSSNSSSSSSSAGA